MSAANPYIVARIQRYNALRAAIDATMTRAAEANRDLTAQELAEVTDTGAQVRALHEEIGPYLEEHQRSEGIQRLAAQLAGSGGSTEVRVGSGPADPWTEAVGSERVPLLMPSRAQVVELYRAVQEQSARRVEVDQDQPVLTRATVTTSDTGVQALGIGGTTGREPRRIATAAGLIAERVTGISSAKFPIFEAGAAGVQTEGGSKTEYDAIAPGSVTPSVINVWTDYTRQAAMSLPAFEGRLRQKHAALVAKREDTLLAATVLAVTGIQTWAPSADEDYADSLLRAAALVLSSDVGAEPDLAVVNPADVTAIFGGSTGSGGERPESDLRLNLHGMAVYVTSAVSAGTAIVGAWRASSRLVVGMAPTVLVDAVSGLKTNKITTLTEEAVGLAVEEPTGFVQVTFNGP